MKLMEVISPKLDIEKTVKHFEEFLIFCKTFLKLEKLPRIRWIINSEHSNEFKSFGSFDPKKEIICVEINDRHPLDIMRTLAHELVHYKQGVEGKLNPNSGETGSDEENEANSLAGVMMRHFDHKHPEAFKLNESAKVNKSKVKYQNNPKKDDSCLFCTMWRAPNACTAVTGTISPTAWCNIFELKKSSKKILTKAVTNLENKLLATNTRKHTYKEIDKMMKSISKDAMITPEQLHNAFKKKHGVIPDEWIEYQEIG